MDGEDAAQIDQLDAVIVQIGKRTVQMKYRTALR